MCLSADEVNPLCDECFAKEKAGLIKEDRDLCNECRELMTRFCWCCMRSFRTAQEGGVKESVCRECRDD